MKITSAKAVTEPASIPPVPPPRPIPGRSAPAASPDRKETAAQKPSREAAPEPQSVEARFVVDRAAHETVVQLYNADTREVIREIPPEQMRKLSESLAKLAEPRPDAPAGSPGGLDARA